MIKSRFEAAKSAVDIGRACLLGYFGKISHIESKEKAGLVSEADRTCEDLMKKELARLCPDVDFLGEETSFNENQTEFKPSHKARWILDPLDGTTNFVHQFPIFCISLALEVQGEIELGIIDVPMLNQTWTAIRGGGAFCNGEKMSVSKTAEFSDALLATGFFAEEPEYLEEQIRIFSKFVRLARGIRRPGAAAYDLALVSSGVFDLFWEKNLKPWDTAAGKILIEEAGGILRTYQNQNYTPFEKTLVAGNPVLVNKFLQILDQSGQ
ncbi:MAG: inositol monophosphatase [Bdellovibrionales bacterium RIFCSPHIGHO2_01_FULL_40_29]|nr:MAG: inositol monophosphatase [Bdellovibrionales bacterium RIFCSPHIGHO2_01_FULL_40_29]OFZ32837.1 MAG: inositol monophosphatase [Bdellovibrionales bacterium RIFCSPHIGHO2_02_FULL_40_15]